MLVASLYIHLAVGQSQWDPILGVGALLILVHSGDWDFFLGGYDLDFVPWPSVSKVSRKTLRARRTWSPGSPSSGTSSGASRRAKRLGARMRLLSEP